MPGPQNGGLNGSADERTPLTGRQNGSKPLHQDDRAWVRWPMNFIHLT